MPLLPADFFAEKDRAQLERDALAPYLMRQRWFGGKARQIASATFVDWAVLSREPQMTWLTIVEVRYSDGTVEQYQLPLVLLGTAAAAAVQPEAVLARLPPSGARALCDAIVDDAACHAVLRAIAHSADIGSAHGTVAARAAAARPHDLDDSHLPVVRLPAVHSNSALAVGGRYLLKLFRRVEPGINPDVEIGGFLARSGARVPVPALLGTMEYRREDTVPATLAMVQELVSTRMNAWEHALEALATFYSAAAQQTATPAVALVRTLPGNYLESVALVGQRTAELHAALGSATADPDFNPERSAPAEIDALIARIVRQAGDVLDLLAGRFQSFDSDTRTAARQVLDRREDLMARIAALGRGIRPFVKIRIHGDYHLGQVLRVHDDFVIIDFEGEPTRPLVERRAKQSPLRDVAGMVRSFDYAAHAGLLAAADADAEMRRHLTGWSRAWQAAARAAFLREYLAAATGSPLVPADPPQLHSTLDMFVIEKALYELNYEMNNRPAWALTPLTGIMALLE